MWFNDSYEQRTPLAAAQTDVIVSVDKGQTWRVRCSIQWQEAVVQTDRQACRYRTTMRSEFISTTAQPDAAAAIACFGQRCVSTLIWLPELCSLAALIASGSAISSPGHIYRWRRSDEPCATVGPVLVGSWCQGPISTPLAEAARSAWTGPERPDAQRRRGAHMWVKAYGDFRMNDWRRRVS